LLKFNGDAGVRGTVNIAGAITASVWSDALAVLVISNSGYGIPQTRDIVTLYNTSTNYSESKFYDGTNWLSLDAYVNGNLLVTGTVVADKIAASSITADKIATGVITADKMVANTITAASAIIADAAITTAKIANLAVQTAQIDDLTITTAKIANLAVGAAQIGDLEVDTLKIAGSAVTVNIFVQGSSRSMIANEIFFGASGSITLPSVNSGVAFLVTVVAGVSNSTTLFASLYRNGSLVTTEIGFSLISNFTSTNTLSFFDSPGAGSFTYQLRLANRAAGGGNAGAVNVTIQNLLILGAKR
jgi:hypothetical protein